MRLNRLVFVACPIVIVGVAFVLLSVLAGGNSISPRAQDMGVTKSTSMSDETHSLRGGFWRVDGGFVSTIRIKNILVVAPIQVTPILYMADGTTYPLPPVMVPVSGVATVNINDALAKAPKSVALHLSEFGSVLLLYAYPSPGHVIASVAAIDVPRSLSFIYSAVEPMPMPVVAQNTFEGLWWKHDVGVTGLISLTNTTDIEKPVIVCSAGRDGEDLEREELVLGPHTTRVVELDQIARASNTRNDAGGIRVEFQGQKDAIMVNGSLTNANEGYSANMPFSSRDLGSTAPTSINMASVGLMIGKPDPEMMPGFPVDTRFTPYLALRNTTAESVDVALQLNYMTGMQGEGPVTRNLSTQRLHPFGAIQVELKEILDGAGLKSFDGMINLSISFTGHSGDLLVASGSVDQTGTYVFEVSPQRIGTSIGKITGFWSVANGNDAMFSFWNPTDAAQDLIATIYYGDGSGIYDLPLHLGPQASSMIDIRMLIMNKTPDVHGKVITSDVQDGSVSFASAGTDSSQPDGKRRITVVIAGGNFNVVDATCGQNCQYCNGYSNFRLNPPSVFCLVGCSVTFIAQATDSYGSTATLRPDQWLSNGTSVMTVNSSGGAQAVGAGSTYINAIFNSIITWQGTMCVSENMTPNCNPQYEDGYAQVTVQQTTVTLSPTTVAPGGQTSVTVTSSPAVAGQPVSLTAAAIPNSGGHQHTASRPVGTFTSSSGTTNSSGQFTTQYNASPFGGSETISGSANFSTGSQALTVMVPGLVAFGAGTHYQLVGPTASHPLDHYGTATANTNLVNIANQYAAAFPGASLSYNDQSLPQGGQFDINADWNTPHVEHRLGINCDVAESNVPTANKATLVTIFVNNGSPNYLHETTPPHWHLRFGGVGNPAGD